MSPDRQPGGDTTGFGPLIGLDIVEREAGYSRGELTVSDDLLNAHGVLHGSVTHAMADTGMGAALVPDLGAEETCATIEIKISYLRPVLEGDLVCETRVRHRGGSVAFLESEVAQDGETVAHATGSYAIFEA